MGKKQTFVGAPVDIGVDVFIELCMPVVREARAKLRATPQQIGQLYAGFISAAVGSMAADVGKEQALAWAQQTLDVVAAGDFEEAKPRRH